MIWASGIAPRRLRRLVLPNVVSIGLLLILAVVLAVNLHRLIGRTLFQAGVTGALKQELAAYPGTYLADIRFAPEDRTHKTIVQAVIGGPRDFTALEVGALEDGLPHPAGGTRIELQLRQIHTTVMTRNGTLYSGEDLRDDQP